MIGRVGAGKVGSAADDDEGSSNEMMPDHQLHICICICAGASLGHKKEPHGVRAAGGAKQAEPRELPAVA